MTARRRQSTSKLALAGLALSGGKEQIVGRSGQRFDNNPFRRGYDMKTQLQDFEEAGEYEWRWPTNVEHLSRSWTGPLIVDGTPVPFRHALGWRAVYGGDRVHGVTWIRQMPMVEGVEADDYSQSHSLVSLLKRPDKKFVRDEKDIPNGYDGFVIASNRDEIDVARSPRALAVKIVEDNVVAWATHAAIRAASMGRLRTTKPSRHPQRLPGHSITLPELSITSEPRDVVDALLDYASKVEVARSGDERKFEPTPDPAANELIEHNPFAFLMGVIADQGIQAERAWRVPLDLQRRLGHIDPIRMAANSSATAMAVKQSPKLHRSPAKVSAWLTAAARVVAQHYHGDAAKVWSDNPDARDLQDRLREFQGIGQKKAAMAVELLARELQVPIRSLERGDVAYDIHIRRVFLRTNLAQRDDPDHILAVARRLPPATARSTRPPSVVDWPSMVPRRNP